MLERDVERYLVKRVKEWGGEVRKVQWVGRVGAPDRIVMLPCTSRWGASYSNTFFVELKAPGEKPRGSQLREHKRMRDMGQRVIVIDSIEGVDSLLS